MKDKIILSGSGKTRTPFREGCQSLSVPRNLAAAADCRLRVSHLKLSLEKIHLRPARGTQFTIPQCGIQKDGDRIEQAGLRTGFAVKRQGARARPFAKAKCSRRQKQENMREFRP
jgi:hypothetical protein